MSHTPAPWMLDEDEVVHESAAICRLYGPDDFPCLDEERNDYDAIVAELEANARLIAAAPDLLEAADNAQRVMNDFGNDLNWPREMPMAYAQAINELRAAIAKAGGTP